MHPVNYLFDEIYRDYWGIPLGNKSRERKRPALGNQLARQVRMFGSRS